MTNTPHPVLAPGRLGPLDLKNRAVLAPMSRVSTKGDGLATAAMADYYARFARGGFGLLITEGVYTDLEHSMGYPNQPGIATAAQRDAWRPVVDAVHAEGGRILLQIMHAGPLSQSLDQPRGPSRFQPLRRMLPAYSEKQGPFPETTPITDGERRRAIDGLADAAVRGLEAGFDGIEIHAGNGYLLDSFLTHYTNQREDEYGGPTENRVRLIADAIQTVRTAIGPDRLLGVRLSQGKVNDFENKWPGGSTDGAIIFPTVAKSGADYIHFASQSVPYSVGAHTSAGESLTAQARRLTGLPVIANGQLDNAELAADVLARGEGDFISIGLGALLNPDWPKRVRDGRAILPFDPGVFSGGATVEAQFAWEAGRKAA